MRILIVAPSLDLEKNVSGVSAVANFIISHNKECEYIHFLQGKGDGESGTLNRILRLWRNYRRWERVVNGNNGDSGAVRNGAELLRNADATIRCRYEKDNGNANGNGNQDLELGTWNLELGTCDVQSPMEPAVRPVEPGTCDVQSPMEPAACGPETLKYLIPDGNSIVKACRWLKAKSQPKERIAGWDLFCFEMRRVNHNDNVNVNGNQNEKDNDNVNGNVNQESVSETQPSDISHRTPLHSGRGRGGSPGTCDVQSPMEPAVRPVEPETWNLKLSTGNEKVSVKVNVPVKKRVMFMGSSERVLEKIKKRAEVDYPNLEIVTYSPPYKPEFSEEDNQAIINAINDANPDLLWIGMTAPKQEKWVWQHWQELNINCHVGTIGAVFDFYAGTARRAPRWWQEHGLEWLYRLIKEPRRMWRRYVIGNPLFIWNVLKEKFGKS